jgi:hypothetical protein
VKGNICTVRSCVTQEKPLIVHIEEEEEEEEEKKEFMKEFPI